MTQPNDVDDLVAGCVRYLLDLPTVVATLGVTPSGTPWLFQHTLFVEVEGTSSTAAVIGYAGGWSGGNEHNTARFPRLSLDLWADPLRDPQKNVTEPGEVRRRLQRVFEVFDRTLHRPQGGVQWWGDVRTLSSSRLAEPAVYPVPDGNGLLRAQTFYAVEQG